MRKKIFFVIPSFAGGGAERIYINLASHLANHYSDVLNVKLVSLTNTGPLIANVPVDLDLLIINKKRARSAVFQFNRLCNKEKPDYVFSILQASTIVDLVNFGKFKHIVKLTNHFSHTVTSMSKLGGFFFSRALKRSDAVIAMTHDTKKEFVELQNISPEHVHVINNPIEIDSILNLGRSYKPSLKRPSILACGRLSKQKGFENLIDVMQLLSNGGAQPHLYIIGEGNLREKLEQKIKKSKLEDKITLLGYLDNPYPYFANCDVFVLSSLYEGFGNVLVEAALFGLPIVSNDCESGPREIITNENIGKLVETSNIKEMAKALQETLRRNSKDEKLMEIRRRHAEKYSIRFIAESYIVLLKRLETNESAKSCQ